MSTGGLWDSTDLRASTSLHYGSSVTLGFERSPYTTLTLVFHSVNQGPYQPLRQLHPLFHQGALELINGRCSSIAAGLRTAIERVWTSHMCSIGLRSRDIAGHVNRGISSDWRISSLYRYPVRVPPSNTGRLVCPSAMMAGQTISPLRPLWSFSTILISTPGFSPVENTSQVSIQTESRLITEGNQPPIILCPR
ncbi:hypothetical protein TNCV_1108021 [Trichonephila clavipes]|nr:hypothetical protein TNCV_1108021 [Trichonephila clavipes]